MCLRHCTNNSRAVVQWRRSCEGICAFCVHFSWGALPYRHSQNQPKIFTLLCHYSDGHLHYYQKTPKPLCKLVSTGTFSLYKVSKGKWVVSILKWWLHWEVATARWLVAEPLGAQHSWMLDTVLWCLEKQWRNKQWEKESSRQSSRSELNAKVAARLERLGNAQPQEWYWEGGWFLPLLLGDGQLQNPRKP